MYSKRVPAGTHLIGKGENRTKKREKLITEPRNVKSIPCSRIGKANWIRENQVLY